MSITIYVDMYISKCMTFTNAYYITKCLSAFEW